MDQEAIATILVIAGIVLGAVLLVTIFFGPDIKKYWDNWTDPG
jgi:hypothetical protein